MMLTPEIIRRRLQDMEVAMRTREVQTLAMKAAMAPMVRINDLPDDTVVSVQAGTLRALLRSIDVMAEDSMSQSRMSSELARSVGRLLERLVTSSGGAQDPVALPRGVVRALHDEPGARERMGTIMHDALKRALEVGD